VCWLAYILCQHLSLPCPEPPNTYVRCVFVVCVLFARAETQRPINGGEAKCGSGPKGFQNWEFNDHYTRGLIINNVTQGVKHHISTCKTAKEMWSSLAAIFELKAHLTLRAYKRNLESLKADEDTDIIKHLDQLKIYWEQINSSPNKEHHISDFNFKLTIGDSLPTSWDNFTDPYINITTEDPITEYTDHRQLVSSQQFMGIIKEEYQRRVRRKAETPDSNGHTTYYSSRFGGNTSKGKHCKHCGMSNHNIKDCRWLGSLRCGSCGRFRHESANCNNKHKGNDESRDDHYQKKPRNKRSNLVEEQEDEHIVF
jgi:gag-polypeptide of LTR copia-type